MIIWTLLIQSTRWRCSQQALAGGRLQLHLVAGIRGAQLSVAWAMYSSALSPNIRSLTQITHLPYNPLCMLTDQVFPAISSKLQAVV